MQFTSDELDLIRAALDSHIYWQLSDTAYRGDGFVREPGSDDPDAKAAIAAANALIEKIASAT